MELDTFVRLVVVGVLGVLVLAGLVASLPWFRRELAVEESYVREIASDRDRQRIAYMRERQASADRRPAGVPVRWYAEGQSGMEARRRAWGRS